MIDRSALLREAEALEAMAARLRAMAGPVAGGPRVNIGPLERFLIGAFSASEMARVVRWTDEIQAQAATLPSSASTSTMAALVAPILAALPRARLRAVLVHERPKREAEIARVLAEMG